MIFLLMGKNFKKYLTSKSKTISKPIRDIIVDRAAPIIPYLGTKIKFNKILTIEKTKRLVKTILDFPNINIRLLDTSNKIENINNDHCYCETANASIDEENHKGGDILSLSSDKSSCSIDTKTSWGMFSSFLQNVMISSYNAIITPQYKVIYIICSLEIHHLQLNRRSL